MAKNAATEPVLYGKKPDVLFIFPEDGGKKIFAEKLRLAQVSEVFKKQFSGNFDCKEDILIKDISFEIFEIILDYIHDVDDEEDGEEDAGDNNDAADDNEIEISEYNFLEILYMASKYFIFPVIEKVIEFVCPYITADNLLYYYEALSNYQIKKLNDRFQDIFEHHPIKIIDGLNGSEVHMGILKQILESSCLKIDTEYSLYAAVATMMKRVSKDAVDVADEMRKKMGNLIYLIRFPVMSVNEMILCGEAPSLLTHKQFVELLFWIKSGRYSESVQFFSTKKRYFLQKPLECSNCKTVLQGYCRQCKKTYTIS